LRRQQFLDQVIQVIQAPMPGGLTRAVAQFDGVEKQILTLLELALVGLSAVSCEDTSRMQSEYPR
jgi:hypothetical protein